MEESAEPKELHLPCHTLEVTEDRTIRLTDEFGCVVDKEIFFSYPAKYVIQLPEKKKHSRSKPAKSKQESPPVKRMAKTRIQKMVMDAVQEISLKKKPLLSHLREKHPDVPPSSLNTQLNNLLEMRVLEIATKHKTKKYVIAGPYFKSRFDYVVERNRILDVRGQ